MTSPDLSSVLEQLATEVATAALGPTVPLEEKLDALKTAGAYHVSAIRAKIKATTEKDVFNFAEEAAAVKDTNNAGV